MKRPLRRGGANHSPTISRALLRDAAEKAEDLIGAPIPRDLVWSVGPWQRRPRSLVAELVATHRGSETLRLFYKISRVPEQPHQDRSEAQRLLARKAADRPIRWAWVVAESLDPPTTISLAVPGRPIKHTLAGRGILITDAQRQRHRLIGEACLLLEGSMPASELESVEDRLESLRRHAAGRSRQFLSPAELRRLETWLDHWCTRAIRQYERTVPGHGDVSGTNVLCDGTRAIGLIDIGWRPVLPGSDVATFAMRMIYTRAVGERASASVVSELAKGYGVSDFTSTPTWNLIRLRRLVIWSLDRNKRRRRRARSDLQALLKSPPAVSQAGSD